MYVQYFVKCISCSPLLVHVCSTFLEIIGCDKCEAKPTVLAILYEFNVFFIIPYINVCLCCISFSFYIAFLSLFVLNIFIDCIFLYLFMLAFLLIFPVT